MQVTVSDGLGAVCFGLADEVDFDRAAHRSTVKPALSDGPMLVTVMM